MIGQSSEVKPWLANSLQRTIFSIDGGENACVAGSGEFLHFGNDGLCPLGDERGILFHYVFIRNMRGAFK